MSVKKPLVLVIAQFVATACFSQNSDSLLKVLIRNLPKEDKYEYVADESDEQGRTEIGKDDKYGMLDRYFHEIIPCLYDRGIDFVDGLAKVSIRDSVGLIDTNGKIILPCRYKQIGIQPFQRFQGDTCIVVNNFAKTGRVDRRGNIVTPLRYDWLEAIDHSHILVSEAGMYGMINYSNEVVIPLQYSFIKPFPDGKYFVVRSAGNKCGVIDELNNMVVPLEYDHFDIPQTSTYFIAMQRDFVWGVVDIRYNKIVVPFKYERLDATGFHGFFCFRTVGKEGVIDSANRIVLPSKYDNLKMLMPGFFAIDYRYNRNVVNSRGEMLIPFHCVGVAMNKDYMVITEGCESYGAVDTNGNILMLGLSVPIKTRDGLISLDDRSEDSSVKKTGRFYDIKQQKVIRVFPERGKYKEVYSIHEGRAIVRDDDDYLGYIDKKGTQITPCIFEKANSFNEGLASVGINNRNGYIDKAGKLVIDTALFDGESFSNGLARIKSNSGVGYIANDGRKIILPVYEAGNDFRNNKATVRKGGKWGVIDTGGKMIIPFIYDSEVEFLEGLAPVSRNGKWSYIDTLGRTKISLPDSVSHYGWFFDGMARVAGSEKWGFIDKKGTIAITPQFDYSTIFVKGVAGYKISTETDYTTDERYGLMDKTGKRITLPLYRELYFSEKSDLIVVAGIFGYGIINRQGKTIAPCVYEEILPDYTGVELFAANLAGKWGFLNTLGKVVIPHKFDKALSFSEGLAAVKKDGKWGYIDVKGKQVLSFK